MSILLSIISGKKNANIAKKTSKRMKNLPNICEKNTKYRKQQKIDFLTLTFLQKNTQRISNKKTECKFPNT